MLYDIEKIQQKISEELLLVQVSEELFERDYIVIADQIKEYRKDILPARLKGRK